MILSDEIHGPLTLPGATHVPLGSVGDDAAERTITLTSASKGMEPRRPEVRARRRLLAERLPGVRYAPGGATYLAWLDCRALGLGDDPARHFFEHGRVALASGPDFGAAGRGFARLNLGTSWGLVEEAVGRMAGAVAGPARRRRPQGG